jgi:acyl-CoA thioesterase-1
MKFATKLVTLFIAAIAIASSPQRASAQIVALGASNTQGKGVSSNEAFPAQLEAMLRAKGKPSTVSNQGISGNTTSELLARLDSAIPAGTRIVILADGRKNDVRQSGNVAQVKANIGEIRARLQARKIRVIDAFPLIIAAIKGGMVQADGRHMTAEGHRYVASHLAPLIN